MQLLCIDWSASPSKPPSNESKTRRKRETGCSRRTKNKHQPNTLMKTYCSTIIVAFALSLGAARGAEQPRHYVIAIAEGLPKEKGTDVLRVSLDFLLKTATRGDRVEFMNAYRGVRLADFVVPQGSARDRANSREFV